MSIRPVIETRRASPISRAQASICTAPSGSRTRPRRTRSCCLTTSGAIIRGITRRVSLAPAPGDRDDHLCACRDGGAWRQPWQPGHPWAGVVAADDGGAGHPASGDAEGRRQGPDARLPAVGQPAARAEDDRAALSGHGRRASCRSGIEDDGTSIRVVIGDYRGVKSPVDGIAADPQYLDVFVPAGKRKTFKVDTRRRAFAYVFDGAGNFRDAARPEGVLLEKEVAGQGGQHPRPVGQPDAGALWRGR